MKEQESRENFNKAGAAIFIVKKKDIKRGTMLDSITMARQSGKPIIIINEAKASKELIEAWFGGCNVVSVVGSMDNTKEILGE